MKTGKKYNLFKEMTTEVKMVGGRLDQKRNTRWKVKKRQKIAKEIDNNGINDIREAILIKRNKFVSEKNHTRTELDF